MTVTVRELAEWVSGEVIGDGHLAITSARPSVEVGESVFIDAHVSVGAGSTVGKGTRIHAGVVIGRNCHIAEDVILYPNVAIYDGTLIGNRVIIHANAVIGADGFGYRTQKGRHVKVPQLGHVEIADDVEIGHHSAALCHLGNIVCRTGRTVRIDTKTETIIDDVESGALVKRKYREGHWAVPAKV